MISTLIAELCDKQEELELMADRVSQHNYRWKDGTTLVRSEVYYRTKARGVTDAIVMACRIRDKKTA